MAGVNEWNEPIPDWMQELRITADRLAALLRTQMPDRGNRYASRTIRTKGEAAYAEWLLLCRCFATSFGLLMGNPNRALFLARCGLRGDETKL